MRDLDTVDDRRYISVEIGLLQIEKMGVLDEPFVRMFVEYDNEHTRVDVPMFLVSEFGRLLTELSFRDIDNLGRALLTAVFLTGGVQ